MRETIILPDYAKLDQFTLEGVDYSIVGRYPITDFLHRFIDGEFGGRYAFIPVYLSSKPDRPAKLVFWDTISENLGSLYRNGSVWAYIAVYERMTPIKLPERVCGNCKHFRKHYDYSSRDNDLCLSVCLMGSCPIPPEKRKQKRWTQDKPHFDDCHDWNAEAAMHINEIEKLGRASGGN